MGAWGEGPFDNDDAADWARDFEGLDTDAGLRLIDEALAAATVGADDYRVVSPNSELAELWDRAGPAWRASVAELRARLSG